MEMDFPTLAGPRISLRRVEADSPADVEAMHRCYQCPEVHRYTQGRAFRLEEWAGNHPGLGNGAAKRRVYPMGDCPNR